MTHTAWHPREGRGIIPLRPLSVAEIVDAPFAAIRRYPGPRVGVGAVVAAVLGGSTLLWRLWAHDWTLNTFGVDTTASIGLGLLLAGGVIVLAAAGWQTALMADAILGRDSSPADIWARVRPRVPAVVLAALVAAVPAAVFLGLLALTGWIGGLAAVFAAIAAGPAIWLSVFGLFLPPIVVLEGANVRTAVRRALALFRGSWWRCLWLLVLTSLIASVVSSVVLLPFQPGVVEFLSGGLVTGSSTIVRNVLPAVGGTVSAALALPFVAGVIAVLYVDVRIRREAFDLTLTGALPAAPSAATGAWGRR
jgi:hypothetical protein